MKITDKLAPDSSLSVSRIREVVKATKPHGHKAYDELIYLTAGAGTHVIDTEIFTIAPPQLFLVSAGQWHCWNFTEIPKGYVAMFRPSLLSIKAGHPILKSLGASLRPNDAAFVETNLHYLEQQYLLHPQEISLAAGHLISAILIRLQEYQSGYGIKELQKLPEKISDFLHHLENEVKANRPVQQFAAALYITPRYLNHLCRKHTGLSSGEIWKRYLLHHAKRYLFHTSLNAAQIADQLGFTDGSHFSKFIRRHTGMSPTALRNSIS